MSDDCLAVWWGPSFLCFFVLSFFLSFLGGGGGIRERRKKNNKKKKNYRLYTKPYRESKKLNELCVFFFFFFFFEREKKQLEPRIRFPASVDDKIYISIKSSRRNVEGVLFSTTRLWCSGNTSASQNNNILFFLRLLPGWLGGIFFLGDIFFLFFFQKRFVSLFVYISSKRKT